MDATERSRKILAFKAQHPDTVDFQEALALTCKDSGRFSALRQQYRVKPVAKTWCSTLYARADIDRMWAAEQARVAEKRAYAESKRAMCRDMYHGKHYPGQQFAHCGAWHPVTVPFTCPQCQQQYFGELLPENQEGATA